MSSTTQLYNTANLQELYATGLYSDLELLCGDHRWNLHRAIVHHSSPSFAASRDSSCEEGDAATITLDDEVPELLELVVRYFYEHDYADDDVIIEREEDGDIVRSSSKAKDEEASNMSDDYENDMIYIKSAAQLHSCLLVNVHIYTVADSLNIPDLKQLAIDKFKMRLIEQGQWPYYNFTEVVATILNRTTNEDDGLRPIILGLLMQHASDVLGHHDLNGSTYHEGSEEWIKILSEHTDFVLDLWRNTAEAHATPL